jgi:hypothetical protein
VQTVSFPTSYLKEMGLPYESYEDNLKIIKNQESSSSRWSIYYELIFQLDDKFYQASYSRGATEIQDESPWEYEKEVQCTVLEPHTFTYKNWKGEVSQRRVIPLKVWFGVSKYHEADGAQWFLKAYDIDKQAERDFAMKDIIGEVK